MVDDQVSDSSELVTNEKCRCGFGEPWGSQCDCAEELHHKGYNARVWVKSTIHSLRFSDLESIISLVEDVRDKNHTKVNEALDDIVVALFSFKQ